jgi:hypothetical protein
MKKLLTVIILNLLSIVCFSQEFLGIKPDGTKTQVINQFIAKGFKVTSSNENVTTVKGTYSGTYYEVNVVSTLKSKKVWKLSIYLPEIISWYSIKAQYETYLQTLTDKYGEPNSKYDFFSSPYSEGDGYEMTALAVEKCTYMAFWDIGVSIEISKFKQVKISYENPVNAELNEQEKKEVNKSVF